MHHRRYDDDGFSSLSREADGADFHGGSHNQWSFWRIRDSKLVVHESALHNGFILQHNLVAVTALESLLIAVAVMCTVLYAMEVPYHTEFAHCCHKVTLLFTAFGDLKLNVDNIVSLCIK